MLVIGVLPAIPAMAIPTIQMASFGIQDSLFLMLLALVVFGPRRLPEIGRQIGKLMYEFRKVSNDFKFQMEEELRASEEADRQRKLQAALPAPEPVSTPATSQALLDVPPHPVADTALETVPEAESTEGKVETQREEQVPAVQGEVRGEPRRFPPILPPSSGETIAAARPFRGQAVEHPETAAESVTESGAEPTRATDSPVVVADEGRIGTEVQPGVSVEDVSVADTTGSEREPHHA